MLAQVDFLLALRFDQRYIEDDFNRYIVFLLSLTVVAAAVFAYLGFDFFLLSWFVFLKNIFQA